MSGAAWEAAGWVAYAVTSVAILFRRRFPWPVLALTFVVASISAGVRASQPAGFYLVMALYSLVVVSSRRTALIVASVVSAGLIAAVIAGGGGSSRVVPAAIGSVALVGLGWLAGENVRATRVYAERYKERAAERAAAIEAERVEQVRRAVSDERVEIARELHDIVAHAMSVIAVRSGVARMVIDSQPEQAREALTIIETTTRRSLQEMRLLVGVLRDTDDHHTELGPAPGLARPRPPGRRHESGRRRGHHGRRRRRSQPATRGRPVRVPDCPGGSDQRGPPRRSDPRSGPDRLQPRRGAHRGRRRRPPRAKPGTQRLPASAAVTG